MSNKFHTIFIGSICIGFMRSDLDNIINNTNLVCFTFSHRSYPIIQNIIQAIHTKFDAKMILKSYLLETDDENLVVGNISLYRLPYLNDYYKLTKAGLFVDPTVLSRVYDGIVHCYEALENPQ